MSNIWNISYGPYHTVHIIWSISYRLYFEKFENFAYVWNLTILRLSRVKLFNTVSSFFFRFELYNSAESWTHVWYLGSIVSKITWDWFAFQKDTDQWDTSVFREHGGDSAYRSKMIWHFDTKDICNGSCLQNIFWKGIDSSDFCFFFIQLKFWRFLQAVCSYTPVFGELLNILQGSKKLDWQITFWFLADLSQKIMVLGQVFIWKVHFSCFNNCLLSFGIGKNHFSFVWSHFWHFVQIFLGCRTTARFTKFLVARGAKELLRSLCPKISDVGGLFLIASKQLGLSLLLKLNLELLLLLNQVCNSGWVLKSLKLLKLMFENFGQESRTGIPFWIKI